MGKYTQDAAKMCIRDRQCLALVLPEGRKAAGVKPAVQRDLRFIERAPELDPVAERGKADPCVILEPRGEFRVQEPALLKQAHGQIPVIQIDEGRDAAGQQLVDHAVTMIDGQLVDRDVYKRQRWRRSRFSSAARRRN